MGRISSQLSSGESTRIPPTQPNTSLAQLAVAWLTNETSAGRLRELDAEALRAIAAIVRAAIVDAEADLG